MELQVPKILGSWKLQWSGQDSSGAFGEADVTYSVEVRPRPLEVAGRTLEVVSDAAGADHVTIRGGEGQVELEVTLTERGPLLRFRAAELQLESEGLLSVRCDELDVQAKRSIRQHAGGDLEQVVAGDSRAIVRGDLITQVNQEKVWEPAQVVAKYKDAKKTGRKELLLLIERVNGFFFMPLPVK